VEVAITTLSPMVGTTAACRALGQARSSWYRAHRRSPAPPRPPRPAPRSQPRALSAAERQQVLKTLHAERFWDAVPASVYAALLDEGVYLASVSTMYRLLRQHGETGDRRRHATHPAPVKPELVAHGPNQVWSWDITKLAGPAKWSYYHLYVILDVYSRYVVGWMVAHQEAASLAERLLAEAISAQQVDDGQLSVHADRGTSMTSKPVALLLADLGVTRSHSRPHVPDDNPLLREPVQDPQAPPELPGPVRLDPGCPRLLPRVLPLVQLRALPLRDRPADPGRRALWPRRTGPRRPPGGAQRCLRCPSGTVRPHAAHPAPATAGSVDQQARRPNGGASAIPRVTCLTEVDGLRRSSEVEVTAVHTFDFARQIASLSTKLCSQSPLSKKRSESTQHAVRPPHRPIANSLTTCNDTH
jgi:putative transposase